MAHGDECEKKNPTVIETLRGWLEENGLDICGYQHYEGEEMNKEKQRLDMADAAGYDPAKHCAVSAIRLGQVRDCVNGGICRECDYWLALKKEGK